MPETAPSSKSTGTRGAVIAVALVLAVVVVGLVLVQTLGGDDAELRAEDSASPAAPPAPGECTEPPPLPADPASYDVLPPTSLAEDRSWTATVATNCGDIVMQLDGQAAPQAVASFLFLAEEGYWDASPCHRLTTEGLFVLQCGDPTGTGTGGPGYGYGVENAPEDGVYPRGTLAMARTSDPETNGSQFFIVHDETELSDPFGYTVFGEVTEGMDIVDRIVESGVGGELGPEAPNQPISILDITIRPA